MLSETRTGKIEARQYEIPALGVYLVMKRSFRVFGFCALLALVAYAAFVRENRRRTAPATKSEIVVAEDGTVINLRNNFTVVGPKSTTNASASAGKK